MSKLNGMEYKTDLPDISEMYENYLCRTERQWLTGERSGHSFEPVSGEVMDRHFDYAARWVHSRLVTDPDRPAENGSKNIVRENYRAHRGFLGKQAFRKGPTPVMLRGIGVPAKRVGQSALLNIAMTPSR